MGISDVVRLVGLAHAALIQAKHQDPVIVTGDGDIRQRFVNQNGELTY